MFALESGLQRTSPVLVGEKPIRLIAARSFPIGTLAQHIRRVILHCSARHPGPKEVRLDWRSDMRKKSAPFQYLLECSQMSLEDFELARLDRAANLRKQLRDIAEEWVEAEVEAQLAHWVRGNRRRSVERTESIRLSAENTRLCLSAPPETDDTRGVDLSTGESIGP